MKECWHKVFENGRWAEHFNFILNNNEHNFVYFINHNVFVDVVHLNRLKWIRLWFCESEVTFSPRRKLVLLMVEVLIRWQFRRSQAGRPIFRLVKVGLINPWTFLYYKDCTTNGVKKNFLTEIFVHRNFYLTIRQNIHSTKRSFNETFIWPNINSTKWPFNKTAFNLIPLPHKTINTM